MMPLNLHLKAADQHHLPLPVMPTASCLPPQAIVLHDTNRLSMWCLIVRFNEFWAPCNYQVYLSCWLRQVPLCFYDPSFLRRFDNYLYNITDISDILIPDKYQTTTWIFFFFLKFLHFFLFLSTLIFFSFTVLCLFRSFVHVTNYLMSSHSIFILVRLWILEVIEMFIIAQSFPYWVFSVRVN